MARRRSRTPSAAARSTSPSTPATTSTTAAPTGARRPRASCAFEADGATVAARVPPRRTTPPSPRSSRTPLGARSARAGVPVYLALGNHDVATWARCVPVGDAVAVSRAKACLEVAHRAAAWKMPARHYVVEPRAPPAAPPGSSSWTATWSRPTTAASRSTTRSPSSRPPRPPAATTSPASSWRTTRPRPRATTPADFDGRLTARDGPARRGGGRRPPRLARRPRPRSPAPPHRGGLDVFVSGNGCARPDRRAVRARGAGRSPRSSTAPSAGASPSSRSPATGFTWRVEDERGIARYCCAATRAGGWTPCRAGPLQMTEDRSPPRAPFPLGFALPRQRASDATPHPPLRNPRQGRRPHRRVRRLGDAGPVLGHPRRARGGPHPRRPLRRLPHGRGGLPRPARRRGARPASSPTTSASWSTARPSTAASAARAAGSSTT